MVGDTDDPDVWSPEDLELFLHRLRDPSRARAATALYCALAMNGICRAAAGAYRGTRLVTPTLSLYGTVLYDGTRTPPATPGSCTRTSRTPTRSPSRTSPERATT